MFDVTGAALQKLGLPVNTLTRNAFLDGRREREASKAPNPQKMQTGLENGRKFKAVGLAARCAGWLYEHEQQQAPKGPTGQVGKIFTVTGPEAEFLARRIASRHEEWI